MTTRDGLTVFAVYIYAWCSFMITLIIWLLFYTKLPIFVDIGVSNDRTIDTMMKSGDIDGILDALSYGYYVEDKDELIASTLFYVKPDKKASWYSNIISDSRIDAHIEVLLENTFLRQSIVNAMKRTTKWKDHESITNEKGVEFCLDSLLRGEQYLQSMIIYLGKEFATVIVACLIAIARYKQYVQKQIEIQIQRLVLLQSKKKEEKHQGGCIIE